MKPLLLSVVLFLAPVAGAQVKKPDAAKPAAPTTPAPTTPTTSTTPGAGQGSPAFKLIGNGRTPRYPVRYQPPVGTVDRVEITSRYKRSATANGFSTPRPQDDSTRYTIRAEVVKETEEGVELSVELVAVEGDFPGQHDPKVRIDCAKGSKGTLPVSRLGECGRCELKPPEGAPADAAEVVRDASICLAQAMLLSLPADDVGPGASWVVSEGNASRKFDITFKVQSCAKDRFTVQGFGPAPETDRRPDMGIDIKSCKQEGTITTENTVAADHALPVRASFLIRHSFDIEGEKSGRPVKLAMTVEEEVSLRCLQSTPGRKTAGK
jgi:hypothetical protein